MTTNKGKRKTVYDPFRSLAVKFTAKKFQVTEVYIYQAINGTAKGGRVDEIRHFYTGKYAELKKIASSPKSNA